MRRDLPALSPMLSSLLRPPGDLAAGAACSWQGLLAPGSPPLAIELAGLAVRRVRPGSPPPGHYQGRTTTCAPPEPSSTESLPDRTYPDSHTEFPTSHTAEPEFQAPGSAIEPLAHLDRGESLHADYRRGPRLRPLLETNWS